MDNGEWHHVLVELKSGKDGKDIKYMALVSLDYGMFQVYYLLSILLCIFICRPPKSGSNTNNVQLWEGGTVWTSIKSFR